MTPDTKQSLPAFLILRTPGAPERRIPLGTGTLVIGRDPDCRILISDRRCSRHHCHIVRAPEGWRLTDLSTNGTTVNGANVTEHLLRDGDELTIGDTSLSFSLETPAPAAPKNSWIVPKRAGYRCTQLAISLILLGLVYAAPLDDVVPFWGATWEHLTRPVMRPAEPPAPTPSRTVVGRSPNSPDSQSLATRNLQLTSRNLQPSSDFDPLSSAAWLALEIEVRQSVADGDWSRAISAIDTFKKGPYFARHIQETFDLEKKVGEARRRVKDVADRRTKELRDLLERCRKEMDDLVAQERFDDALAMLHALRTHKALTPEADGLITGVNAARKAFAEVTLPRRRELLPVLYAEMRPFTARLDFAGATKRLKELEKDAQFQGHRPLLTAEAQRLEMSGQLLAKIVAAVKAIPRGEKLTLPLKEGGEVVGKFEKLDERGLLWLTEGAAEKGYAFHQIAGSWLLERLPEDHRPPLVAANFLLVSEEFEQSASVAVDTLVTSASPEDDLVEFYDRHQRVLLSFRESDLAAVLQKGDERAIRRVKAKYEGVEENGDWRKGLDERLVDASVKPSFGKPELAKMAAKIAEQPPANADAASRAKLSEEKIRAIKNLRVVADEKDLAPLIAGGLEDSSSQVRMETCRILGSIELRDREIVWKIVKLLDDPLPQVGEAAIEALTKLKIDQSMVKQKAKSPDGDDRRLSAVMAGAVRDRGYVEMLKSLLKDPLWQVRKASAVALAKINDRGASGALLDALKTETESDEVQVALGYALSKLDHESAVPALTKILQEHPRHRFKHDLLRYLGDIGGAKAAAALKPFLRDLDAWARYYAADGISRSGVKVDLEDARRLLLDDSWMVRGAAARMVAASGKGEKELELLIRLLDDKEPAVRGEAVVGLERWREERVVPAIIKAIPTLEGEGQGLAMKILETLTKQKLTTVAEWERWWNLSKGTFRLPPVESRHEIPKNKELR